VQTSDVLLVTRDHMPREETRQARQGLSKPTGSLLVNEF
jgi:hypothetical protein